MRVPEKIKFLFLLFVILMNISCAGPQKKCEEPLSPDCVRALELRQKTIDSVVWANFPSEMGYYKGVVWEDDFDNAWVIKGREINITRQFIQKLSHAQRICVAAHELAHLKLGHYYSRMGIIMATESPYKDRSSQDQASGRYDSINKREKTIMAEGFGLREEEEADELALGYIRNLGLPSQHYLNLLLLFHRSSGDKNTDLENRVRNMKYLLSRERTAPRPGRE